MIGKKPALGIKLAPANLQDGLKGFRSERRDTLAVWSLQRAKAAARCVFRQHKFGACKLFERPQLNARDAAAGTNCNVGVTGFRNFDFDAAFDHRKIDKFGEPLPPGKTYSPNELDRFTSARLKQSLRDLEKALIYRNGAPSWLLHLGPTGPRPGAVHFKRISNCRPIFQPQHDVIELLIASVRL